MKKVCIIIIALLVATAVAGCAKTSPPDADFSGTPTSDIAPLQVQFTDKSTGEVSSWQWSFGDGDTNTTQNPSHVYLNPGKYTVSLKVTGPDGSDTETKFDYIEVLDDFRGGGAEAAEAELHNVEVAVTALMADAETSTLATGINDDNNMHAVTAIQVWSGLTLYLDDYMTGLHMDDTADLWYTVWEYTITTHGIVTQGNKVLELEPEPEDEVSPAELHNVETAVTAMMADAEVSTLATGINDDNNMHAVTAIQVPTGLTLYLNDYMAGLHQDDTADLWYTVWEYTITTDGTVRQGNRVLP